MSSVVYDGTGGGTTGGGTTGGSAGQTGDFSNLNVDSNKFKYLSSEDIKNNSIQKRLSTFTNTVAPITVTLPDETYIGNAEDIIKAYGTNLNNVENPFKPYITGYTESIRTATTNDGYEFTYTKYTPTYEYSDAYYQFEKALQDAKEEISKNDNKSKSEDDKKTKTESDYWELEFEFILSSAPDELPLYGLQRNYELIPSASVVSSSIDGSIYDWFAGGVNYDAPRAGGTLFNETGDLNTVRFLGLQDKNYNKILQNRLTSPAELYRMLNITAGNRAQSEDSIFAKLAQSQRANAPEGAITVEEYERGKAGLKITPTYTKSVDQDALDLSNIREGENNNLGDFFLDVVDVIGDDEFTLSVKDVADNAGSSISDGLKGIGNFLGF